MISQLTSARRSRVSPSSRRATSTRASCSWATWATSSSVVSTAARAERAHKLGPKGVEYYVSYAGRGTEGYWLGKAAASLGLVGAVDPAAFRALAKGEHPDGGRLLERVATDHTPGWDFTLSAPKSVSLAWALADEPLRAALAEAHRGAVKAAFSFLEDEGGRAPARVRGPRRARLCGARRRLLCPPRLAGELDPQLHTHGIVCNVVEGSDGRWTALDSRMIYMHRRAAASIYRAELRERVAELGGQWLVPDRRGLSELEGFDREVLRSFSQRRNAIEAELERTGRSGPRASEAACLKTRPRQARRRARGAARHLGPTCPARSG